MRLTILNANEDANLTKGHGDDGVLLSSVVDDMPVNLSEYKSGAASTQFSNHTSLGDHQLDWNKPGLLPHRVILTNSKGCHASSVVVPRDKGQASNLSTHVVDPEAAHDAACKRLDRLD
jgi:hypothetical protein